MNINVVTFENQQFHFLLLVSDCFCFNESEILLEDCELVKNSPPKKLSCNDYFWHLSFYRWFRIHLNFIPDLNRVLESYVILNKPGTASSRRYLQGSKIAKGLQSVKVFSSTVSEKPNVGQDWRARRGKGGRIEIFHPFFLKSSKK